MYAEVVVLTSQGPDVETFTYKVPEDLKSKIEIGQLVCTPFGKSLPFGLITQIANETPTSINPEKVKPITSIALQQPILLHHQIQLLFWMHSYYRAPMVNCLKAMLPKIPTSFSSLASTKLQQENGQTLILLPSINQIPQTIAKFKAKNFAIYHGEQKIAERFSTWQKIFSGNVDFVFGTRSAIFAPCPNLKEIIIFDEHEEGYTDERSPYYKTLTVAEKLQQLTQARLQIIDSSPKTSTYFTHQKETTEIVTSAQISPKVKTVSMVEEKQAGNKSPLSEILQDYIKRGLQKNKKILLFLNKKTESGRIYCKSCKYSSFAKKQPDVCPQCGSADIFFASTNIKSLAALVKKLSPNVPVNVISSSATIVPEEAVSADIATAAVFYRLLVKKYDLVAHIYADSLLNIADFTSGEKLFNQVAKLKSITKGLLLIQTLNPQDATIQAASSGDFQKFYKSQIQQRKMLSYPPFSLLIKLSTKGKSEQKLEEKANKLFENLTEEVSPVQILGPYKPAFTTKTPKYNIIFKIPTKGYLLKDREKALESASPLFSKVPNDWQIEVETESTND